MKKITVAVIMTAMILSTVSVFAQTTGGDDVKPNVPVVPNFGESIYELSSPTALTSGVSVTGGAIFSASPESLIANPALISKEQRVKLNLADTVLFSVNSENEHKAGDAFQAGIIIPTKMFVIGGYLNGTFVNLSELPLGNSVSLKAALSKEITDKLSIGVGLNGGLGKMADVDWALSANLGFVYNQGNVAFMKDFRYGVSILNLGKNFASEQSIFGYPSLATIKAGAAASLYRNDIINVGANIDLTTPCFRNLIFDMGLQLSVKDMLVLSVAEKINLAESIKGNVNVVPSVSLSFKFSFDVQKKENEVNAFVDYIEKNDWSESEMKVSAGWKQLYTTANAVSLGVDLSLGMKDTTEPVIDIWFDEVDDE